MNTDREKAFLCKEAVYPRDACQGYKASHPLVSVTELSCTSLADCSVHPERYAVVLMESGRDEFIRGRERYDYSNATIVFLPPGQSFRMDTYKPHIRKGWLLTFHPHFIYGTTLDTTIRDYTFFSYEAEEALHLSLREKTKAIECLSCMEQELRHAIDRHSRVLISRYIELLLDYCARFYDRQFITRCEANKKIMDDMNCLLDAYIRSGKLKENTLPSARYCSDNLRLSIAYFNDLLKFETGKTLDEYFLFKRLDVARRMLREKGSDVCRVAGELGFSNTQCFNKLFRKMIGVNPDTYKLT